MKSPNCVGRLLPTTIRQGITKCSQPDTTQVIRRRYCLSSCHLVSSHTPTTESERHHVNKGLLRSSTYGSYPLAYDGKSRKGTYVFQSGVCVKPKNIAQNSFNFGITGCIPHRLFSSSSIRFTNAPQSDVVSNLTDLNQSIDTVNPTTVTTTSNIPDPTVDLSENGITSMSNIEAIANTIEPSFKSLGLAHWWPSGFMQSFMESIHLNLDLSWSGTIILTTIIVRLCVFPLVLRTRKVMVKTNNNLPEFQKYQYAMHVAKKKADQIKAMNALRAFQKEKGINPMAQFAPMISSGIVFSTMFFALRGMANCPVESMKVGGLGWFLDLTASDPLYLLPLLTSSTMFLNIKWGVDGGDTSQMPAGMVNFMKFGIPLMSLPIMLTFPSALCVYWFTTNVISVLQGSLFRIPWVTKSLGVGELKTWADSDLPMKNVDMFDQFSANVEKAKAMNDSNNKITHNLDKIGFDDALQKAELKKKNKDKN